MSDQKQSWWVYLLECADGTLYCGSSPDVDARIELHNRGKGARFTRGRGPVRLFFKKRLGSKSEALREEASIKRLPRSEKLRLGGRA